MAIPYKPDSDKDPFDGEYIGNIWGWRFSLVGLGLIVLLSSVMVYRHWALGVPFGGQEPIETAVETPDSLQIDTE